MGILTLYPVTQSFPPVGRNFNRPGTPLQSQGATIHCTDTPGAPAVNEVKYFSGGYRGGSAHTFIDWTSIIEYIPDSEMAWHAGPTANSMYLGFELCMPLSHDLAKFTEIWKRAVWYTALKFYQHRWTTGPGLWSHAGISERWHETDHQDPVKYFAEYSKTFANFVDDVDNMIEQMKNSVGQGGSDVLPVAVLLFTKEDYWAGADVAAANGNCAVFTRGAADKAIPAAAFSAQKLIVVGGPTTHHTNEVLLSGNDKYLTAAAVGKYLG